MMLKDSVLVAVLCIGSALSEDSYMNLRSYSDPYEDGMRKVTRGRTHAVITSALGQIRMMAKTSQRVQAAPTPSQPTSAGVAPSPSGHNCGMYGGCAAGDKTQKGTKCRPLRFDCKDGTIFNERDDVWDLIGSQETCCAPATCGNYKQRECEEGPGHYCGYSEFNCGAHKMLPNHEGDDFWDRLANGESGKDKAKDICCKAPICDQYPVDCREGDPHCEYRSFFTECGKHNMIPHWENGQMEVSGKPEELCCRAPICEQYKMTCETKMHEWTDDEGNKHQHPHEDCRTHRYDCSTHKDSTGKTSLIPDWHNGRMEAGDKPEEICCRQPTCDEYKVKLGETREKACGLDGQTAVDCDEDAEEGHQCHFQMCPYECPAGSEWHPKAGVFDTMQEACCRVSSPEKSKSPKDLQAKKSTAATDVKAATH